MGPFGNRFWHHILQRFPLLLLISLTAIPAAHAYCPGELGEAFKSLEFRTHPPDTLHPYNLHRRMMYLDYWLQELGDTIGLKILFFRALQHHSEITWDDVLAEMTALKKRAKRAGIGLAELVDRPLMPSFKIFDPTARDVVAAEVAVIRKTFEALTHLEFMDQLLIFSGSPTLRDEFLRDVYVTYRLNLSSEESSDVGRERAASAIRILYSEKLRNIPAIQEELKNAENKSAVVLAVLQTLTQRVTTTTPGRDVFQKWIIKIAKTLILFDTEFSPQLLSEDVVAQAQALEKFYTRLPHHPLISEFPPTLLEPIQKLRTQVPTLFHEWERRDLRNERRAGFIEFLPVPRIIAFYLAPESLLPYVFHPNFTFYTIEHGMEPAQLLGLGVHENHTGQYLSITHLPDLEGPLMTRLFGTLQTIASQKGFRGVVLPKNQRRWPSAAAARANHLIDTTVTPFLLQPSGQPMAELSHRGVMNRARALGRRWLAPTQEEFALVRPITAQSIDVHTTDLDAFRDFVREFFEKAEHPHMDLDIVEQIEVLLELMKRSNLPDANPIISTLKDLYKIVYEDRVQEFLEGDPRRATKLAHLFVDFFRYHPNPEVRYQSLEVMEKIMRRELGISVEVAKPKPEPQPTPIDWVHVNSPVLDALLTALRTDDSYRVRLSIMILLSRLDRDHFFPDIIERAKFDPSETVQKQGIWYLKTYGRPEHKEDLKEIERGGHSEEIRSDAHAARLAIIDRERAEAQREEFRKQAPNQD